MSVEGTIWKGETDMLTKPNLPCYEGAGFRLGIFTL